MYTGVTYSAPSLVAGRPHHPTPSLFCTRSSNMVLLVALLNIVPGTFYVETDSPVMVCHILRDRFFSLFNKPLASTRLIPPVTTMLSCPSGNGARDQNILAAEPPAQLSTPTAARDGSGCGGGGGATSGVRSSRGHYHGRPILTSFGFGLSLNVCTHVACGILLKRSCCGRSGTFGSSCENSEVVTRWRDAGRGDFFVALVSCC